jgi:Flp pilus assembly protein TadG
MGNFLKNRIKQGDKGTAAIEFALLAPLMALMLAGLFDVSQFIYCNNQMITTAQELSNIITRGNVTAPQLQTMMQAATYTAQPFVFTNSGNVIVTSVSQTNSNTAVAPTIMWQASWPGGTGGSRISPGSLPGGLSLAYNETVIFTEVFYTYSPVFTAYSLVPSSSLQIYQVAAAVPRQGTMTTLPPS